MSKVDFVCNHCGYVTKSYASFVHEQAIGQIDDKWYCNSCIQQIALYFVQGAEL